MAASVGGLRLVDAKADHHVEMLVAQPVDHARSARRVVGRIAVDQHVDIGFDVGEHAAHDVTLALALLAAHDGAGLARKARGAVVRIVVVDVDLGRGQRRAKTGDDGRDRRLLVVAGHQHRDARGHGRHRGSVPSAAGAGPPAATGTV